MIRWQVSPDRTDMYTVLPGSPSTFVGSGGYNMFWAPDGGLFFYFNNDTSTPLSFIKNWKGAVQMEVAGTSTGGTWSPDARWLGYRANGSAVLYFVDTTKSPLAPVEVTMQNVVSGIYPFSASSAWMAATTDAAGYLIDMTAASPTPKRVTAPLPTADDRVRTMLFDANSDVLYYIASETIAAREDVYRVDLNNLTAGSSRLSASLQRQVDRGSVGFSTDGSRFYAETGFEAGQGGELWIFDVLDPSAEPRLVSVPRDCDPEQFLTCSGIGAVAVQP